MPTDTGQLTSVPVDKLTRWPGNVRKTSPQEIKGLAENIDALGLLQNLIVLKIRGKYAVVGGERRRQAIELLVQQSRWPKDQPVPCLVTSNKDAALELSLAENIERIDLTPWEQFDAFHALTEIGATVEDIAARFGVKEDLVLRRLKLARIHPTLLERYRAGEDEKLTLACLEALALSDDAEEQLELWESLPAHHRIPQAIRRNLIKDEIPASDKRVRFIGLPLYEHNAGLVRRDLFAQGEDGIYLQDTAKLERLCREQIDEAAKVVKDEGWKWVEAFIDEPQDLYRLSRIRHDLPPLLPKFAAEQDALKTEHAELEELVESGQLDEDDEDNEQIRRMTEIATRLEELDERPEYREVEHAWTKEKKETSGVFVFLDGTGGLRIERGLRRKEDQAQAVKADIAESERALSTVVDQLKESSRSKTGYSAALTEELTQERTAALQVQFAQGDSHTALVAVVHALLMAQRHPSYEPRSCLQIELKEVNLGKARESEAAQSLAAEWERLGIPRKSSEVWEWLTIQLTETLLRLLAVVVAPAINAVQMPCHSRTSARLLHTDILARRLGFNVRKWFLPTVENSLNRLTKAQLFEALSDLGKPADEATRTLKKGTLAEFVAEKVYDCEWVPEPMRTRPEDPQELSAAFNDRRQNIPSLRSKDEGEPNELDDLDEDDEDDEDDEADELDDEEDD